MRSFPSLCRVAVLATFCQLLSVTSSSGGEHRFTLVSSNAGTRVESFDLADNVDQVIRDRWQVTQRTLHGGLQDGVQLITIDNGKIRLQVVPTRGMSILNVCRSSDGSRIFGWDSPVREVVHPHFVDLESRGGLGWLQGFNEWMVRCGLEFAGHPGTDSLPSNTGDAKQLELTLHGRIGNIPASEVELFVNDQPPYALRLRGVVEERMFSGPQLRLTTELRLTPDQAGLALAETITNLGASDQEYQVIYHTNFGKPLLEENAKVVLAAKQVTPMNSRAAKGIETYDTYLAPTLGYVEQVYLVEPLTDAKGMSAAVLHNAAKTQGALMRWSTSSLPYLTLWKNTAAEADGYVTGIEPGSGFPFNRRVERHFGRVPALAGGESRSFSLEFEFLEDANTVARGVAEVQSIAAGRTAVIDREPPEVPAFDQPADH